jgi:zinc protease
VVNAGGAGRFNAVALDKILNGKAVAVRPYIGEVDQGARGGSTPQDLETMFQLLYLRFTQPRADPAAFAALRSQALAILANQMASPEAVFNRAVDAALNHDNPRWQPETPATVERWDLDKAMAFYKARFADASNFTFVFVGSFTPDKIRPLVETYIASLPATRAHETWRDSGATPSRGVIEQTVEKGIAPKSEVAIVFSGPFEYTEPNKLALETMVLLLESRLSDAIREELGGTYSITASPESSKFPRPQYRIRIDWTCDPARTADLTRRVMEEVDDTRNQLLTSVQVGRIRDVLLREYDRNSQDNGYLLAQIARVYANGDAAQIGDIVRLPDRIAQLTASTIQAAAQKYLDLNNYVQITLKPEAAR